MTFCDLANRNSKELAQGVHAQTFWGDRMLLSYVELGANSEVANHSHPHEQCGVVLEGELVLSINGEPRTLVAGDCYVIPGGIEHWARTSKSAARVVDIFSPIRGEYKY